MAPFVEVQELDYAYLLEDGRQIAALRGVSFSVDRGTYVAVIGSNGSGKSTLAQHLNALLRPTSGRVLVDGLNTTDPRHLWQIRQRVGMVFQNPENQLVASTLEEDVAFGPENWAMPREQIRDRVEESLRVVGLWERRHAPPQALSGGQKQLLAVAGALALQPSCLVLDEPTSMLDPVGRERVLRMTHHLNRTYGMTVFLMTHSMEAATSADQVLVMHQGTVAIEGTPRSVFRQIDQLKELRLASPVAAEIARLLREVDVPLDGHPLTVGELADMLGPWRDRGAHGAH